MPQAKIHFVGLCGAATGPLAVALAERGYCISGSDDRPLPPISDVIAEAGLYCAPFFAAENVPEDAELVIVNAFYDCTNPEVKKAKELGLEVSHFAQFLGTHFLKSSHNIVVAGSYGKTTTTSMLAWILEYGNKSPSWLVGGVCPNLENSVRIADTNYWVVEGDEYRSGHEDAAPKFKYYNPEITILTALDHVHRELFPSFEHCLRLYAELIEATADKPVLAPNSASVQEHLLRQIEAGLVQTVGFTHGANILLNERHFDGCHNLFRLRNVDFEIRLRGEFACINAAMAALAAERWGVSLSESAEALRVFKGVRCRQETIADLSDLLVIHDNGIYPLSIGKLVRSVAETDPSRRLCVLFQPRYTTGSEDDYYRALGNAFSCVDLLLVTDTPVPQAGISGWFTFDPRKLQREVGVGIVEVGPALKCFPTWSSQVQLKDKWLLLVDPMFPEPVTSIRRFCSKFGSEQKLLKD